MSYVPALPFDDRRHLAAHHFLVEEAAILDAGEWSRWLDLLTDDVRYVMPVRVTTVHDAGYDDRADMAHFDEDRYAIEKRVQRLLTGHAWTEDPRSRTRHLVTNVRTFPGGEFGLPCVLVLKRLNEGERHEKSQLNAVLRDHGVAT